MGQNAQNFMGQVGHLTNLPQVMPFAPPWSWGNLITPLSLDDPWWSILVVQNNICYPRDCNYLVHTEKKSVALHHWALGRHGLPHSRDQINQPTIAMGLDGQPHGPLTRYVKLRFAHMRRECRERFPRHRGSLTSGFLGSRWRGETFPVFPAHAQPPI